MESGGLRRLDGAGGSKWFIRASGSLKEMAAILGVSYPTVRNRLDEIIGKLKYDKKIK